MKLKITSMHCLAGWTWGADEVCGICEVEFDRSCPNCKFPGDDCPISRGECRHIFHLHCILRWLSDQQQDCPMCRRPYTFL